MPQISIEALDTIERALKLQGEWDKALEEVEKVRKFVASEKLIDMAREHYGDDDIEIDDDAGTSPHDTGCWVQAWVHVRKPTEDCPTCGGDGRVFNPTAEPEEGKDYLSLEICSTCDGEGEVYQEFDEGEK